MWLIVYVHWMVLLLLLDVIMFCDDWVLWDMFCVGLIVQMLTEAGRFVVRFVSRIL